MNQKVWDDPFSKGVTFMNTATLTTKVGGHTGYYGIRGIYTTESNFDLNDFGISSCRRGFRNVRDHSKATGSPARNSNSM